MAEPGPTPSPRSILAYKHQESGHQDNHREELRLDKEGDWAEHEGVQCGSSSRAAGLAGNNCSRRRQVEDDVLG